MTEHAFNNNMRSGFLFYLYTSLLFVSSVVSRQEPTSYCKCICFQNSTIIPLNAPASSQIPPAHLLVREFDEPKELESRDVDGQEKQHHKLTCDDCNRAFCLDYNLPICKNAREEDVFATCFRTSCLSRVLFYASREEVY